MKTKSSLDMSVYFIADPDVMGGRDIVDVTRRAIDGGVTMVQLRDKSGDMPRMVQFAKRLRVVTQNHGIPFLINDRVDVALVVGADGVHLGQGDLPPREARKTLGPHAIIGWTAYTDDHMQAVDPDVVDYVGTGPFYATLTKPDKPVLGPEKFADLVRQSPVPVVGIGGITADNANAVFKAGADGVAMMRGISEAEDPVRAAREFVQCSRKAAA